ncbi:MAG: RNA pseudouridine synthase [Bacteroidales bacterium]|nr:RNA pseudouridine synthase [Bacteroidales bacterium]
MLISIDKRILYEDNHILIVNKFPGEIVQGDKTGDVPLADLAKEYLKNKYAKPGNVYLGVIHRIDRPVCGIVIFAKTSKAAARMSEMIKKRDFKKYYYAITCAGLNPPEGSLRNYLSKNEKMNKSFVKDEVDDKNPAWKLAELNYRVAKKFDRYYLIEIELITGRHHQIRAQLAHAGAVIKGDLKYGAPRSNHDASISLQAYKVEFVHPITKQPVVVECPEIITP